MPVPPLNYNAADLTGANSLAPLSGNTLSSITTQTLFILFYLEQTGFMRVSILFLKSFFKMLIALTPIWGILAILVSGLGIWVGIIEGIGWKDGLYFGWITGTTVGYGDIIPHQPLSKFLSVIIGLIGIINTGIGVTIAVNAGKETLIHASGIQDDVKKALKKNFAGQ